jgi:hypothetical protein
MGFNRRFPPIEPTNLFDMRYPERVKLLRLAKGRRSCSWRRKSCSYATIQTVRGALAR